MRNQRHTPTRVREPAITAGRGIMRIGCFVRFGCDQKQEHPYSMQDTHIMCMRQHTIAGIVMPRVAWWCCAVNMG